MHRAQLFRRAHVGLTLIADDLVSKPKLFQQPQHALGAGIVEMMDGKHGDPPGLGAVAARLVVPAGRWKVEMSRCAYITRMLLTTAIYPDNIGLKIEEFRHESGV